MDVIFADDLDNPKYGYKLQLAVSADNKQSIINALQKTIDEIMCLFNYDKQIQAIATDSHCVKHVHIATPIRDSNTY